MAENFVEQVELEEAGQTLEPVRVKILGHHLHCRRRRRLLLALLFEEDGGLLHLVDVAAVQADAELAQSAAAAGGPFAVQIGDRCFQLDQLGQGGEAAFSGSLPGELLGQQGRALVALIEQAQLAQSADCAFQLVAADFLRQAGQLRTAQAGGEKGCRDRLIKHGHECEQKLLQKGQAEYQLHLAAVLI